MLTEPFFCLCEVGEGGFRWGFLLIHCGSVWGGERYTEGGGGGGIGAADAAWLSEVDMMERVLVSGSV